MRHSFLLSLIPILGGIALAQEARTQPRLRTVPLFNISYPAPPIAVADHGDVTFTEEFAFFGTDGGVFRARLPLSSSSVPQRVAFESTPVTGLARGNGALYAILDNRHPTGPGASPHSLLKSADDGDTWTPIDQELYECLGAYCEYMVADYVEVVGDRIFVNAGANVLVSGNEGQSWTVLHGHTSTGKPQSQACYNPAFTLVGRRLLIGGECPLDIAYLRTGVLQPDLLDWEKEPEAADTPYLENRNVQFIRRFRDSDTVFAGIEGAVLRSDDAGASYEFILKYDDSSSKYPYITHILFPAGDDRLIIIGGFDKANGGPYLAFSSDAGSTWSDESHLLPGVGEQHWSVSALDETPSGQIILAVEDDHTGTLYVSELRLAAPARRRPAR